MFGVEEAGCGRGGTRAGRRRNRDRTRRGGLLLARARHGTGRADSLRPGAGRRSRGLGDGGRVGRARARHTGPRRRRQRGVSGRGRRGDRRRAGMNRDGRGRWGCARGDGRRGGGFRGRGRGRGRRLRRRRRAGAGRGGRRRFLGRRRFDGDRDRCDGRNRDRCGGKLRRWSRLENILRWLRRRLNALLRNRLRVRRRFGVIARQFVQILRLQLTLRLRQRCVTHRRDAFDVRNRHRRICGRRLRNFDRGAAFERYDFAA